MSTHEDRRRPIRAAAWFLVCLLLFPACLRILAVPDRLRLPEGETRQFRAGLPWVQVRSQDDTVVRVGPGADRAWWRGLWPEPVALESLGRGRAELELSLFGWLPIRRLAVDVVPPLSLVPGGHSIGVQLESEGVMVVGFNAFPSGDGRQVEPGREAGLELGDVILSVDGDAVAGEEAVEQAVQRAGKAGRPVVVEARRGAERANYRIQPILDRESGRYRLGLYVRGGVAGIGTLTFFDPRSRRYGALGHVIADVDTNQPVEVRSGRIVPAAVTAVERGTRSHPGEKIGMLEPSSLGTIERNTRFGIIGEAADALQNPLYPNPIPVGLVDQVEEGAAEILTVIKGRKIERFAVEIQRVLRQGEPGGKGMVIRIADPRLLEHTGGIVQGMSGSPIIQNGRLVGAVTHVFVNDPTRGYGIFIEWMLRDGGVFPSGSAWNRIPGAFARVRARLPALRAVG